MGEMKCVALSLLVAIVLAACASSPRVEARGGPSAATPVSPRPDAANMATAPARDVATATRAPGSTPGASTPGTGARIALTLDDGSTVAMLVVDMGHVGATARPATAGERTKAGEAIEGDSDAGVLGLDSNHLLIAWVGSACERGYVLTTRSHGAVIAAQPR